MKNIILTESPLQLSLAIDLEIDNKYILTRLNGELGNDSKIQKLSHSSQVKTFISPRSNKFLLTLYSLYFFIKYFFFRGNIYVGDYKSFWMKVVACVPFKNSIIYCDDGMSTVELYNDSVKNNKECTIRTILPLKSTEFITIQSLPIDVYDNRNLEKATYLLGSAFSFNRILNRTDYINLLLLIIENSEYPVFFFPHRYEELEVIEQLESMNVCQVCNIDISIESYIYADNVPSSIISFNSTALYILSSALPYTSVRSIDATELMTSDDRERFKQTYDFFRDSCDSIEVLTVRDMNSARS